MVPQLPMVEGRKRVRRMVSIFCFALLVVYCPIAVAAPPTHIEAGLAKSLIPAEIDYQTWIDANQLLMFVTNIGSFAYDNGAMLGKADGLYYPKGTNLTALYAAGLWLGGKVKGDLRVSLAEYSHTYVPGPMVGGTFQSDRDEFKVYKIIRSLLETGFYEGPRPSSNPEAEMWDDYHNWPAEMGAPVDGEGNPKFIGDQTLWCVFNDASPAAHVNSAGSAEGLGVEIQQTVFAFDREGPLGNCIFMRYLLVYKGGDNLGDMYVSFWADPELGDGADDFVGCDTISNIGYCYNATNGDDNYGNDPPAVGFCLLNGPMVPSPDDSTFFLGQWRPGFRNLQMTSFAKYINGTDPDNAQETYWYMQGLDAKNSGVPFQDPVTHQLTNFMLTGDPVTGSGWIDCCAREVVFPIPFLEIFEIAGPGGVLLDPPDNVFWSWNSTHEWYISSDAGSNIYRLNWRGHIGDDTWEFRFTNTGSEYYEWNSEEKYGNRAPFELWNLGAGTPEDPTDKRIQFAVIDDDESNGWSPGDRIYPFEREYYEPLPHIMEYTWDDDFRIGRIVFNAGVPQEGTVVSFTSVVTDTIYDTLSSDRRYMLSSGPFDMEPNDTQEVVMAVIVGQGSDRLSSVTDMRDIATLARTLLESGFEICDCSRIGDLNDNGLSYEVVDVVYMINYALCGGPTPPIDALCPLINRGDINCDDRINLLDIVMMVHIVFGYSTPDLCDPCG